MKQLHLCLSVIMGVLLSFGIPLEGYAENAEPSVPEIVISEIKIKNDTTEGGYNEFIELYNLSTTSINLNLFTIEYYNAPSPGSEAQPIKKVVIADGLLLPGHSTVLAANKDQIPHAMELPFSSLSDSGGLVRVSDVDGELHDEVAWTSTSSAAVAPILYLPSSSTNRVKSFTRSSDEDGNPAIVNPAWQLTAPTPVAEDLENIPVPETEPDPEPIPEPEVQPEPEPVSQDDANSEEETNANPETNVTPSFVPLQISELLPNPASPATDAADEYIELYNPTNEAVDLNGYKLQTGNSYGYSYTFTEGTLLPNEYRAFYVSDTGALLANSGGRARLLGPGGQVVYETAPYDTAKEGEAWAYVAGPISSEWQWTTTLTPDAGNVLTLPFIKAITKTKNTTKAAAKPKSTKASSTKKAAATTKSKSTKPTSSTTSPAENSEEEVAPATIHPGIVAGVGALALGYGLWEYRHDFRNRLYQFRRYRAARRAARVEA